MSTLDTLLTEYKTADQKLEDAEKVIIEAKADRSRIAKQIHDEHGAGPHKVDGIDKVATQMKGTFFLRIPFQPGRKKAEASA